MYKGGSMKRKDIREAPVDKIINGFTEHADEIISELQEHKLRKQDINWETVFNRIEALGNEYNIASNICEESQNVQCLRKVDDAHDIQREKILKLIKEYCD
jgi:hypothetical protein